MVNPDVSVFSRMKSKADYDREKEAFEINKAKALAALAPQPMSDAGKRAYDVRQGFIQPGQEQELPFTGNAFDSQVANELYRYNVARGLDPVTAKQDAINKVLGSKSHMVQDPVTGNFIAKPRSPVFDTSGQQPSPPPMPVMSPGEGQFVTVPTVSAAVLQPQAPSMRAIPQQQQPGSRGIVSGTAGSRQPTLYELADKTAGAVSAVKDMYGRVAGQFGLPVPAETTKARQTMEVEKNALLRALSNNPRFPVGEMERLEKEINISPSMFDSPQSLKARMESIGQSLTRRLADEQRAAQDLTLPVEARKAALEAANNIRNFVARLGVPSGQQNSFEGFSIVQ